MSDPEARTLHGFGRLDRKVPTAETGLSGGPRGDDSGQPPTIRLPQDFDSARDIDVLFKADQDFRQLAKEIGARYLGKFRGPLTGGDVRRLSTITIEGVGKPVQCISDSSVATFEQWPHTVLLRDGRVLNEGKHHTKQAA